MSIIYIHKARMVQLIKGYNNISLVLVSWGYQEYVTDKLYACFKLIRFAVNEYLTLFNGH